jgi:organic hydroperoxide reductase OsmC/OhrA
MATYGAKVDWALGEGDDFLRGRYSRAHTVRFDGGFQMPGSPSPHVVPAPWSVESAVDPEEAFVAAISTCHMLTFLHKAREAGLVVASYSDEAEGVMGKTAQGRLAMVRVTLRPAITYVGHPPTGPELEYLHHAAHEDCYIANSVATEIVVEGRDDIPGF